jgi:hypothetical protein
MLTSAVQMLYLSFGRYIFKRYTADNYSAISAIILSTLSPRNMPHLPSDNKTSARPALWCGVQSSAVLAQQYLEGLYNELCQDVARTFAKVRNLFLSLSKYVLILMRLAGLAIFDHGSWPAFLMMSLIVLRSRLGMLR